MKKILVPVDGSRHSHQAVETAVKMAKQMNSRITLINVVNPVASILFASSGEVGRYDDKIAELSKKMKKESENLISRFVEDLKKQGIEVEGLSLEGYPADLIIKYAEEKPYDLVIMGSVGLGKGAKSLILGSTTNKVMHQLNIPLLIVKEYPQ